MSLFEKETSFYISSAKMQMQVYAHRALFLVLQILCLVLLWTLQIPCKEAFY